jgi:hypothetical protein
MIKKKKAVFLTAEGGHFRAYPDGVSTPKTGWRIVAGMPANPAGWFVYQFEENWYLIEGLTGLSVGQDFTINGAIQDFTRNAGAVASWQEAASRRKPVAELPMRKPDAG